VDVGRWLTLRGRVVGLVCAHPVGRSGTGERHERDAVAGKGPAAHARVGALGWGEQRVDGDAERTG
jgi:hypothetical protein